VVREEPDLDALPAGTPGAVRRLLGRCLRNDPRNRLPDMGAARLELQDTLAGTSIEVEATAADLEQAARAVNSRRVKERWAWAAVALAASALAATLAFVHLREVPEPRLPARFVVDAPEGWTFTPFEWPVPSPDGRQVLFHASPEGQEGAGDSVMLWTRPLESLTARPLPGTGGAGGPFWSPDGRFVGFFAEGELRKLSLADGTVQRICALPGPGDWGQGDWNEKGTIIFPSRGGDGASAIYAVAATGGEPKPAVTADASRGENRLVFSQFLPDGQRVVFVALGEGDGVPGVYVASLGHPDERRLLVPGLTRTLHAGRHVLSATGGTLLAQPFDAERAELTGEAVAIASSVGFWAVNPGIAWLGVSPGGTLAYFSGQAITGQAQLAWLDRNGGQVGTIGAPGHYGQIALSPDERNVAVEIPDAEGQYDLWVMDVARGVTSRVTATPESERDPVWSPDGRSLAFIARTGDGADLRRKGLRASEPETVLTDSPEQDIPESWSSDGETLLFLRQTGNNEQTVWALPLSGEGEAEPVLTAFRMDEPQLSPDGRWLAYISDESGRDEIYVEPFRREGDRVRVSVDGGGQPKWRGDGKELFFTTSNNRLMAVEAQAAGDRIEVSLPVELFEIRGLQGTGYDDYAPSADGQRFLVKLPIEEDRKRQLHVVTNWPSLLE
jgi:Tol biopolymer transport system component